MKESPIFTRSYDLLCWLIPVTVKFPRQQRFVLAEAVQRTALQLHEQFISLSGLMPGLPGADQLPVNLVFYGSETEPQNKSQPSPVPVAPASGGRPNNVSAACCAIPCALSEKRRGAGENLAGG